MPGSPRPASRSWPAKGCCFSNPPLPSPVPAHLPSPLHSSLGQATPPAPASLAEYCAYRPPGWKPGSGPDKSQCAAPPGPLNLGAGGAVRSAVLAELGGSRAADLSPLEGRAGSSDQPQSVLQARSPCGLFLGSCPAGDSWGVHLENSGVCFQKVAP